MEKFREYFCGFCFPNASDGTDAEESSKDNGILYVNYTGKELAKHIEKKHRQELITAWFEEFEEAHQGEINGHDLWTGEKYV